MDGADYKSRLYDMLKREPEEGDGRREEDGAEPAAVSAPDDRRTRRETEHAPQHAGVYMDGDELEEEEDGKKGEEGGKKKKKKKDKKKDDIGSSRGVETLFRTSYTTHMDLSALADNKANIMISINGIIISVLLASISPKIDANPWLLLPTVMVLISCLVSLACAIFAALPRVNSKVMTQEQLQRSRNNILFFGNFTRLTEDQYVDDMTGLLKDLPRMYTSMMRDIYGLGQVLAQKFNMLRISYITFMIGLFVGVAMFVFVYVGQATVETVIPPPVTAPAPAAPLVPSGTTP